MNAGKSYLFYLVIAVFSQLTVSSQSCITGQIITAEKRPLNQASALLFNASDSSLVGFALSGIEGSFQIPKIKPGLYYIQYQSTHFVTQYSTPIRISTGRTQVKMSPQVLPKRKNKKMAQLP